MAKKGKGWHKESHRHSLARRGIKTGQKSQHKASIKKVDTSRVMKEGDGKVAEMVINHPFIHIERNEIVKTSMYKKHPVVVVDSWNFGGMWNPENKLIIFDKKSWDDWTSKQRECVIEHEIIERRLAMENYEKYHSHSNAVRANHNKANRILEEKYDRKTIEAVAPYH